MLSTKSKRQYSLVAIMIVVMVTSLLVTSVAFAAVTRTNPGFETGNLSGWSASGPVSVVSSFLGFTAPYGGKFAVLTASGCPANTLTQNFSGVAGDIVSGQAAFKTTDYLPYNDYGMVRILQGNVVLFYKNVAAVGNFGQSPWTAWSYTIPANGTYTLQALVQNQVDCGVTSYLLLDSPSNLAPTANAGGSYLGDEGLAIAMSGASASDPDLDTLTYAWTVDSTLCSFDDASALNPNLTCSDNGNYYTATLSVDDGVNPAVTSDASVTVSNVAPTLGAISVDQVLVPVNTAINANAGFTDPGTLDTHSADWDWGDTSTSAGTVTQGAGSGSVNDSHSYSVPGVYTVKLTVTDNDGDVSNESVYQYVVVYDPSAGFVTGGGWIDSPAGAYTADPSLTGKANFGFVAKYKQGANVPDGNTQFQFKAGDLNFHSSSYQWLVVAGARAQFKGEGTINGSGHYGFMLTAIDGQINGGGGVDKFRIKIWDMDNGDAVVYDNQIGGADDAVPNTSLGGGSIVIHK